MIFFFSLNFVIIFLQAFDTKFHPIGKLIDGLVDVFRAAYIGIGAHPRLLPHAVQEIKSYVKRIYKVIRSVGNLFLSSHFATISSSAPGYTLVLSFFLISSFFIPCIIISKYFLSVFFLLILVLISFIFFYFHFPSLLPLYVFIIIFFLLHSVNSTCSISI